MIPGIAPVTIAKVGGGGSILGTITVGNYLGYFFGYAAAGNVHGLPSFGSISGDAANYIDGAFVWEFDELSGAADAKNTTKAKLVFQGLTYEWGSGGWEFGPEVSTWPTSGTHTFEIIDP